jgi:hypothetical protein
MCPRPLSEANSLSAVIQSSPVQYGIRNTLVKTESSVTAGANQYISRHKRCHCCPCTTVYQIRCKTIWAVKLIQFKNLAAYVDLREAVSAMIERYCVGREK